MSQGLETNTSRQHWCDIDKESLHHENPQSRVLSALILQAAKIRLFICRALELFTHASEYRPTRQSGPVGMSLVTRRYVPSTEGPEELESSKTKNESFSLVVPFWRMVGQIITQSG